jgi:hypothetical protein
VFKDEQQYAPTGNITRRLSAPAKPQEAAAMDERRAALVASSKLVTRVSKPEVVRKRSASLSSASAPVIKKGSGGTIQRVIAKKPASGNGLAVNGDSGVVRNSALSNKSTDSAPTSLFAAHDNSVVTGSNASKTHPSSPAETPSLAAPQKPGNNSVPQQGHHATIDQIERERVELSLHAMRMDAQKAETLLERERVKLNVERLLWARKLRDAGISSEDIEAAMRPEE